MYVRHLRDAGKTFDTLEVRYSTPAVQLIREDQGRVVGAVAKTEDGSYLRINASRGVLIATGGYDANPEMMQAWVRPEDYESSSWWNPSWGTTGDGHMMGLKVGADMDSLPHAVMNFSNATPGTFVEKRVYFPGPMNLGIIVTDEGKRFVNENNPRQYVSNCVNVQIRRGRSCFSIWNQSMFGETLEKVPNADKQIALDEEKGYLFRADTIEELAAKAGIDEVGLKDTIKRYDKAFEDGLEREPDYYRWTGNNKPFGEDGPWLRFVRKALFSRLSAVLLSTRMPTCSIVPASPSKGCMQREMLRAIFIQATILAICRNFGRMRCDVRLCCGDAYAEGRPGMKASKKKNVAVSAFVIAIVSAALMLAACSQPSDGASGSDIASSEQGEVTEALYPVSDFDAKCLGCHGGSYEAVAKLTENLGEWNPHDSLHGGYVSCENCHAEDMSVQRNYCNQCHAYAPTEDSLFLEDSW